MAIKTLNFRSKIFNRFSANPAKPDDLAPLSVKLFYFNYSSVI